MGFSEIVKAGSDLIKIYKADGTLVHSIAASDTSQVTFNPTKPIVMIDPSITLLAGTSYYVIIEAGALEDLAGNDYAGLSSPTAFNFNTTGTGCGSPPGAVEIHNANGSIFETISITDTSRVGGSDKFVYNTRSDSAGRNYDTIVDLNASADLIDLWFQVTGVDIAIVGGSLSTRGFDAGLA